MRNPPPKLRQIQRAVWLAAIASVAGLAGVWYGKNVKARAPVAAFASVSDESGKGKWETLRKESSVRVGEGETLDWVTASRWETVKGPGKRTTADFRPEAEQVLWLPLRDLAARVPVNDSPNRVVVLSPLSVTRFRVPEIDWVASAEETYDVAIIDLEDEQAPPRLLTGVTPPVSLSRLETPERRSLIPGRIYRVQVRKTGDQDTMGFASFLVAEDATQSAPPFSGKAALDEALRAMYRRPFRTGDAWVALRQLSPQDLNSELALRLRYVIALEQGDVATSNRLRRSLLK